MATIVEGGSASGINPKNYRADQGFFLGISVALSLFTFLGFAQLAARGITDPVGAPVRVHGHAFLLVGWLALFCTQNWLAWRGNLSLHRLLGRSALLLVAAIVVANYVVTMGVIVEGRTGSAGFTPSSFLALGVADTLAFAGLIVWALVLRRDTQWHRRLMFGATLMLSAAGINRWLSFLSGPVQPVLSIALQLAFVAVIAWHDRKALGHVHKATIALFVMVAIQRATPNVLPRFEPWNELVKALVG